MRESLCTSCFYCTTSKYTASEESTATCFVPFVAARRRCIALLWSVACCCQGGTLRYLRWVRCCTSPPASATVESFASLFSAIYNEAEKTVCSRWCFVLRAAPVLSATDLGRCVCLSVRAYVSFCRSMQSMINYLLVFPVVAAIVVGYVQVTQAVVFTAIYDTAAVYFTFRTPRRRNDSQH